MTVILIHAIDALEIQPTATDNEIKKAYRKVIYILCGKNNY